MNQTHEIKLSNITLLNFLSRIVFYLFVFIVGIISSRQLSNHAFGEVQFLSFLIGLSWMGLNFGLPGMLGKFWPSAIINGNKSVIDTLLKRALITGLVSVFTHAIFLIIIYQVVVIYIPIWHLFIWAVSNIALAITSVLMQATYRYKQAFYLNLFACSLALTFLLTSINYLQQLSYIYCFVTVNILLASGYAYDTFRYLRVLNKHNNATQLQMMPTMNGWIKTSAYFAISTILAGILWQRFELSFIKHYFNFDQLAIYVIAFTLVSLFAEPLKLIPSGLLYYFSGIQHDHEKAAVKFADFFINFSWLVFFCGIFIYMHAETVVVFLYTSKYAAAAYYTKLLLLGFVPGICGYVFMNMHTGLGKARFLLIQDTVCALLFITGMTFAIPAFGLTGAALAKSATMIISVCIGAWYTKKRLQYDLPLLKPCLSLLLAWVLIYATQSFFNGNLLLLLAKGICLFLLYLLLSFKMGLIRKSLFAVFYYRIQNYFS